MVSPKIKPGQFYIKYRLFSGFTTVRIYLMILNFQASSLIWINYIWMIYRSKLVFHAFQGSVLRRKMKQVWTLMLKEIQ